MKESSKNLAPPKLTHNLKKMERALKGCRRIAIDFNKNMKKDGRSFKIGKTTAYQVMKEMGLYKKPQRKIIPMERPMEPLTSFAMDFKEKALCGGKRIHVLNLIDEFNDAIIILDAHQSPDAHNVIKSLQPFAQIFRYNKIIKIRVDNGKEFQNDELASFCYTNGIVLNFTEKGCPWMNAFVERNIRSVTEECLNLVWLNNVQRAQDVLTMYKHEFNRRENMGLDYRTPLEVLTEFHGLGRSTM